MEITPLVSIIVPIYMAEKTLVKCVTSIVNQTYYNLEIILVDDGSPDNSGSICDYFDDKRITVIHNCNHGVAYARNTGIAHAHGEYITFCDADDYYSTYHIEKMVNAIIKYNADVVISGYYIEDDNKFVGVVGETLGYKNVEEIVEGFTIKNIYGGFCWNKLFKREVVGNIKFPEDLVVLEDTYFLLSVLQNAKLIYYLASPTYYYCFNDKSITRKNIEELIRNDNSIYILSYQKILDELNVSYNSSVFIYATMFEVALNECKMLIDRQYRSAKLYKNLIREVYKNKFYFYICKSIPIKHKFNLSLRLFLCIIKIRLGRYLYENS